MNRFGKLSDSERLKAVFDRSVVTPAGCWEYQGVRIEPSPGDDPCIVESWV